MPTRPYALAPEKLHFMIELRDILLIYHKKCYNITEPERQSLEITQEESPGNTERGSR